MDLFRELLYNISHKEKKKAKGKKNSQLILVMVWWFSMAWKRKDTVEDINVKQGSDADTMLLCQNSIRKQRRKHAAPCRRQNVIYGVKQP